MLSQVLCLLSTKTESGLIHFVTLREPFQWLETSVTMRCGTQPPEITMELFPRTHQSFLSGQLVAPTLGSEIPVWLSDDMLLLDLDTFELDEYFTDAERAGSFHIEASDYFNQIFDMCRECSLAADNLGDQ